MCVLTGTSLPGTTTLCHPLLDSGAESSVFSQDVSVDSSVLERMSASYIAPVSSSASGLRKTVLSHKNWLWKSVESLLTPRQLQIFELYLIYGYTQEEIDSMLHLSGQAVVSVTIKNCIVKLRKKLGPALEPLLRCGGQSGQSESTEL